MTAQTIWVIAAGMRRAASTLQYHLAEAILEPRGAYCRGWAIWQTFGADLAQYDGKYPYVLLKTHACFLEHGRLAKDLLTEGRLRVLTCHRHPGDMAASMKRMGKVLNWPPFEVSLPAAIHEFNCWTAIPPEYLHVSPYWRLFKDAGRAEEVAALHEFLVGEPLARTYCEDLASDYTVAKQRARLPQDNDKNEALMLWKEHVATGRNDLWKTELTPAERAKVAEIAGEFMGNLGYTWD